MFLAPRIVAVDDEPLHLQGLVEGLHRYGTSCLPIHFTGDATGIKKCPALRIIFADLHLNEGGAGGNYERHFSVIGGLIEEAFSPAGPYVLILWTRYADQADGLKTFLEARLENVTKPLAVVALDKATHLDLNTGKVKDAGVLVSAIDTIIRAQPQLAALLKWEERVLDAAADTISALLALTNGKASEVRPKELSRLLARLAVEAVGEGHIERDRFGAVSEALLPILADRIAFVRATENDIEIWKQAFDENDANAEIVIEEAARLNRMLHVDESADRSASERGSIVPLPADRRGESFKQTFGLDEASAAAKQFGCKSFDTNDEQYRWMLVQTQAACDFAQRQPGTIPYLLGLEMPCKAVSGNKPPDAVWKSPPLFLRKDCRYLYVNCRFQYFLPPDVASGMTAAYRLREQLLTALVFATHSYGARPGPIVFHQQAAKAPKK